MSLSNKRYACAKCGHETTQQTNHYGQTYGIYTYNECPKCPPFRRPTVWKCLETPPLGEVIPEPWTLATVTVRKARKAKGSK